MELVLYTRAGCHLCEEAKAQLAPLVSEFGLSYNEVDVDSSPELATRFGEEVPVVFLDGRKVAKYRVDVKQLRRRLAETKKAHRRGAENAEKAQRIR
jgi:glutaredoxin